MTVVHASPSGTSHSPLHSQSQSISAIISFIPPTNASTEHIPDLVSSAQPLMGESGATPSLTMMRIWGVGVEAQESTRWSVSKEHSGCKGDVRWNWTFEANGANLLTTNDRSSGISVYGSGPPTARVERLSAVSTTRRSHAQFEEQNEEKRTIQDNNLVSRVDVQAPAVKRERNWVIVQRRVRAGVVLRRSSAFR